MVTEKEREQTAAVEPLPYLGRSARIVGDWRSVDVEQTPHNKNNRGELGKALYYYRNNRVSPDPLSRIETSALSADRRNTFERVLAQAPTGAINPERVPVPDPKAMTAHIKRVAKYLGASDVGIMRIRAPFLYAKGAYPDEGTGSAVTDSSSLTPEEASERYPYAIALVYAWDYEMGRAHRHRIGDAAYHFGAEHLRATYANLASYIKELGYSVVQRVATPMPVALAAGLGEMGRHGMLITEHFGARVHLGSPILTDMPLVTDEPIDLGVTDFCQVCNKCATACPTNSITTGGKAVVNGVEKFKINWETCYRLRPHVVDYWSSCLTCVAVCPYTKPNVWWRTVAIRAIKWTPIPLRGLVTRPLKWIDDTFWGKLGRKRVRFMSYDSGSLKLPDGTQAGTNDDTGYYYPLKENARRFDLLKAKLKSKGDT